MNQNDHNRYRCVNNQLCEQICTKLHRIPPKKWHVPQAPKPEVQPRPDRTPDERALLISVLGGHA